MSDQCPYCDGRGDLDPYMAGYKAGMDRAVWDSYGPNICATIARELGERIERGHTDLKEALANPVRWTEPDEAEQTDLMCGTVAEWAGRTVPETVRNRA